MSEIVCTRSDFCQRSFKSCVVQLPMSGIGGLLEIEGYSIHQSHVDKPITLLVCNVLIVNDIEKKIKLKPSKFRTLLQMTALFVKR